MWNYFRNTKKDWNTNSVAVLQIYGSEFWTLNIKNWTRTQTAETKCLNSLKVVPVLN
jgi:hypothetical protein